MVVTRGARGEKNYGPEHFCRFYPHPLLRQSPAILEQRVPDIAPQTSVSFLPAATAPLKIGAPVALSWHVHLESACHHSGCQLIGESKLWTPAGLR
jgi:hypothetical protein